VHLTELLISSALILVTLSGAGWVLRAQWDRTRCAYLAFEKTRAKLQGSEVAWSAQIRFRENADSLETQVTCGGATEKVSLKKLEAVQW
jgi:hypothetical protein